MADILNRFDLTGKTALVTGASRGIGRAIALGLAECGAAVAVHYVGNRAAADEVAARCTRSCVVQGDLADPATPRHVVDEVRRQLGEIDIAVLNASVQYRRPWTDDDESAVDEQIEVNFKSVLRMIRLVAPQMAARGWGRVVTIGSVQQYRPHPQMLTYAATKSALENLCRNLARQLAGSGVTVNNISPGVVVTDRNSDALNDAAYAAKVRAMIPAGEFGSADDCVGAVLLLCGQAGRYITGIDLPVDGGLRLP